MFDLNTYLTNGKKVIRINKNLSFTKEIVMKRKMYDIECKTVNNNILIFFYK